jgi:hypothetical protein
LIQDVQNYGSSDQNQDYMVSRIMFDLEIEGKLYGSHYVEVRQPRGTDYTKEPIEVGPPIGAYKGSWNHHDFADLSEEFFRSYIGDSGRLFSFSGNVQNFTMRNSTVDTHKVVEFPIPEFGSKTW